MQPIPTTAVIETIDVSCHAVVWIWEQICICIYSIGTIDINANGKSPEPIAVGDFFYL